MLKKPTFHGIWFDPNSKSSSSEKYALLILMHFLQPMNQAILISNCFFWGMFHYLRGDRMKNNEKRSERQELDPWDLPDKDQRLEDQGSKTCRSTSFKIFFVCFEEIIIFFGKMIFMYT